MVLKGTLLRLSSVPFYMMAVTAAPNYITTVEQPKGHAPCTTPSQPSFARSRRLQSAGHRKHHAYPFKCLLRHLSPSMATVACCMGQLYETQPFSAVAVLCFMQLVNHGYSGVPISHVVRDEVQDFVQGELLLDVLVLGPQKCANVMYCGDTAQTITRGVGFRCV